MQPISCTPGNSHTSSMASQRFLQQNHGRKHNLTAMETNGLLVDLEYSRGHGTIVTLFVIPVVQTMIRKNHLLGVRMEQVHESRS